MIAFAESHRELFAFAAIAVECGIILGLLLLLPRIAMEEPLEWIEESELSLRNTRAAEQWGTVSASLGAGPVSRPAEYVP